MRLEAEASGGIVDLFFGYVPGRTHAQVRYVARAGRQGWRALQEQAGRYLTVRLSRFGENCHLEKVSVVTRRDPGPGATAAMEQDGMAAPHLVGRRTLESVRQEIYCLRLPPRPYDWLAMLTAFATDFYLTGNTATARTVLRTAAGRQDNGDLHSDWTGFPLLSRRITCSAVTARPCLPGCPICFHLQVRHRLFPSVSCRPRRRPSPRPAPPPQGAYAGA